MCFDKYYFTYGIVNALVIFPYTLQERNRKSLPQQTSYFNKIVLLKIMLLIQIFKRNRTINNMLFTVFKIFFFSCKKTDLISSNQRNENYFNLFHLHSLKNVETIIRCNILPSILTSLW